MKDIKISFFLLFFKALPCPFFKNNILKSEAFLQTKGLKKLAFRANALINTNYKLKIAYKLLKGSYHE